MSLVLKDNQQKKQTIQELRTTLKTRDELISDLEYKIKHYNLLNSQLKKELASAKAAIDEEAIKLNDEKETKKDVLKDINDIEKLLK